MITNKAFLTLMAAMTMASAAANDNGGVNQSLKFPLQPFGTPAFAPGAMMFPSATQARFKAARASNTEPASQPITPDWTATFNTVDEFNQWTVIDANGDRAESSYEGGDPTGVWCWRSDAKCAYYNYSYTKYGDNVDDWIATPGLRLKAGKKYTLTYYVTNRNDSFDDQMEVMLGKQPTAAALTTPVQQGVSTKGRDWQQKTAEFTVGEDGVYYLGFHLTSANFMDCAFLSGVSVTADPLGAAPAAVGSLTVTPDATGAAEATITFTAPSKTVDNKPLTSLKGIKIRNRYTEIADITNVKPGEKVSYKVDNLNESGEYTFTVAAYNDTDEGLRQERTLYVGLDIPRTPQNVVLHDNGDRLTVTCDPFTAEHDGVFFPGDVTFSTYTITKDEYGYPAVGDLMGSVKGTSLDIPGSTNDGKQYLLSYVSNAENKAGKSLNYWQTNSVLMGKAYDVPFVDNFDGGISRQFWYNLVKATGYGSTGVYSSKVNSFDTKPGCTYLSAINAGDYVNLYTGKISLKSAAHPYFSLAMLSRATKKGTVKIVLKTPDGATEELESLTTADFEKDKWVTKIYDLSKWKSERYVSLGVCYTAEEKGKDNQFYIDHYHVGDLASSDLSIELTAPNSVVRGDEANVKVRVNNEALNAASGYTVELYADGRKIAEKKDMPAIAPRGSAVATIAYKTSLLSEGDNVELTAKVLAADDQNEGNNTAKAKMTVIQPDIATASGLTASDSKSGVALAWTAAGALAPKTDTFDSYTPWNYEDDLWGNSVNPGDWTMIDVDGGSTGGFTDSDAYPAQGKKVAYTVFNPYNYNGYGVSLFTLIDESVAKPFVPHSGEQYLASVYSADVAYDESTGQYVGTIKPADNWVVSPELNGKAQTLSFWVNNFNGLAGNGRTIDHVETYQVLYSTTGKATTDFTQIGSDCKASGGEWKQVSFSLPEGTKYFAIRHCSPYNAEMGTPFIFMVDDITYNVDNKPVSGYNIYRDGLLIASVGNDATSYTDAAPDDGEHMYQVTVVYADNTESPAISATVRHSGATGVDGMTATDSASYDVYTVDGTQVRHAAKSLGGLAKGVYVVNGKKVVVK